VNESFVSFIRPTTTASETASPPATVTPTTPIVTIEDIQIPQPESSFTIAGGNGLSSSAPLPST
jgi:hypothetical protein